MPSSTFLNLPPEKQEKLLEAATGEFSRRSLGEASINQIIKEAGIPRGSFYMYFADKEDLFRYILRGYVDELLSIIEQLLIREQGDVFSALTALFDYVERRKERQGVGDIGAMSAILSRNAGMHKSAVLDIVSPKEVVERMGKLVNTELLDIQNEGDLESIIVILLTLAAPLIYQGNQKQAPVVTGIHFRQVMNILKRGMAVKSVIKTIM